MSRQIPRFLGSVPNEPISMDNHREFLFHLQSALLLALQEQGRLDTATYRRASEALNRQRREETKRLLRQDLHP